MSNSSPADVELDTIQTLWFCPFHGPRPLPTLKETTKGFFIEGRAVADRSAASFSREAWGMSSSKDIYLEIISCLVSASLTHQICSVTHHLFIWWDEREPDQKTKYLIILQSLAGKCILILILRLRHGCLSRFRVKDIRQTNGLTVTDILAGLGGPWSLVHCWDWLGPR